MAGRRGEILINRVKRTSYAGQGFRFRLANKAKEAVSAFSIGGVSRSGILSLRSNYSVHRGEKRAKFFPHPLTETLERNHLYQVMSALLYTRTHLDNRKI